MCKSEIWAVWQVGRGKYLGAAPLLLHEISCLSRPPDLGQTLSQLQPLPEVPLEISIHPYSQ